MYSPSFKHTVCFRSIVISLLVSFILSTVIPSPAAAQIMLPQPGTMVLPTAAFIPTMLKGVKVYPENPLLFDFIVDTGDSGIAVNSPAFKAESQKLINYFLAALAVKETDMWVNLSPYEKDRIIPDALGKTDLGQEMLGQDYILKQLTASLMYPEDELGATFWEKVYAQAKEKFGTTDIPLDTFNKVWIVADSATVLERNNVAYVTGGHLKVMLEEDYVARTQDTRHKTQDNEKKAVIPAQAGIQAGSSTKAFEGDNKDAAFRDDKGERSSVDLQSSIIKQIIIPAIEKEVNEGKNFASLRQMFYSMVLASWYKQALKNAFLNQVYTDTDKVGGVLSNEPNAKEEIYSQYLEAYRKGVYSYIKEEYDSTTQDVIPRKYFSGGLEMKPGKITSVEKNASDEKMKSVTPDGETGIVTTNIAGATKDGTPVTLQAKKSDGPDRAMLAEASFEYMVREDDTLASLADMFGTTAKELAKVNGFSSPEMPLDFGQKIQIVTSAEKFTYIVQPYDEVDSVAEKCGVTVDQLLDANGLSLSARLKAGTALEIDRAMLSTDAQTVMDVLKKHSPFETKNPFIDAAPLKDLTRNADPRIAAAAREAFRYLQKKAHVDRLNDRWILVSMAISIVTLPMNLDMSTAQDTGIKFLIGGGAVFAIASVVALLELDFGLVDSFRPQDILDPTASTSRKVRAIKQIARGDNLRNIAFLNAVRDDENPVVRKEVQAVLEEKRSRIRREEFAIALQAAQTIKELTEGFSSSDRAMLSVVSFPYTVRDGETIKDLAGVFGTSVARLVEVNELLPEERTFFPGQRILVETQALQFTYIVQPRDTYERIAALCGITVAQLQEINKLRTEDQIKRGIKQGKALLIVRDQAMLTPEDEKAVNGGIDLNADNMNMDVSKEGDGIEMHFDPALLEQFKQGDFTGVVPVIIQITPVTSILPLLGLKEEEPVAQVARS